MKKPIPSYPSQQTGPGEVLVKNTVAGVNFVDTYFRSGLYKYPELPGISGREAAGVIAAVGEGVTGFQVGARVAWCLVAGGYAEYAVVPAKKVCLVPDGISDIDACAAMVQGLTAHALARNCPGIKTGSTVLIHAAAGGLGYLLVQMAKHLGATVIGTVGSTEKAAHAKAAGADHVILYREVNFADEVAKITGGAGVDIVYDGVGAATWEGSLASVKPRGHLVSFGNASGPVPPVSPGVLAKAGSVWLTRMRVADYLATAEEFHAAATEVLGWVASGALKLHIGATFDINDAAKAQEAIVSRTVMGKIVLTIPQ